MSEASFKPATNKRPQTARLYGEDYEEKNPFSVVERLYEHAEKKKAKQALLDEQLFGQKYTFKPTVYSERPEDPIQSLRSTMSSQVYGQRQPQMSSTQLL